MRSIGDAPGRCRSCGGIARDCDVCLRCSQREDATYEVAECVECGSAWPDPESVDSSPDTTDGCPDCGAWAGEAFAWVERCDLDDEEDERRAEEDEARERWLNSMDNPRNWGTR